MQPWNSEDTEKIDHMVFLLPPLLAAACQQLAELEAAGPPVCREPFTSEYWGCGNLTSFFLHFVASD